MNTKTMSQFEMMDNEMLAKVEGGFGGWGDMVAGLLGGLAPSPTLDQLNGKWPIIHFSKPCGPYGIGGTPNSCNGI
ncbi:ComC/BlpC family leader-containing pheromone/bacteriocin [Streptococcus mitis]|nr:ComC/BlpC family leader-containing pheromone/bacteriocin [Streptococcus mitis]MQQ14595.1 ComC/BlpC family leader-containing pheromone/bacteriocin [Streptococcus mitis]MQQ45318.1 ComC/BlpC family leader-containing pheromone/bacteriocin [Streptococcus mitis]MQQ47239.1 ComC/BlpC family leader-containing pheromone/bacteriocin [Streptococcus mitis]MQQ58689.1 ComC/BlpC family leader-containing pheromone/bacteriocin [Streptococcus mitis]